MVTHAKLLQPANAWSGTATMATPSVTCVRLLHPANAYSLQSNHIIIKGSISLC